MSRIFVTLSVFSTLCLAGTFVLGLSVDQSVQSVSGEKTAADWHILIGVGGLIFAVLVHAITLTYFMGTGRWIEETTHVYKLGDEPFRKHSRLKYKTLPVMMLGIVALIMIVPTGASADRAANPTVPPDGEVDGAISSAELDSVYGDLPNSRIETPNPTSFSFHFIYVAIVIILNVVISMAEFKNIEANGEIVNGILDEVRRIRTEKGLPV